MKNEYKILTIIAFVGLIFSVIAHFLTYLGISPQDKVPFIWLLHIGVFIVFVPAILSIKKDNERGITISFEDIKSSPKWMILLCIVFFIYAVVNFTTSLNLLSEGNPDTLDGKYVIKDHGRFVRQISKEEYEKYSSYEMRGFSGHWMFFYSASLTILYSKFRKYNMQDEIKQM